MKRRNVKHNDVKQNEARIALSLGLYVLCFTFFASGCANSATDRKTGRAIESYYAGDYTTAMTDLRPLAKKTDENFVLNNLRLGSIALTAYDLDEAEAAFYRAYEVINSVGVNSGGRSLGAVLVDEKIKIWKGEPFERAMANYYLGLIYYMRRDYNNARAAFENALFKLRDYADAGNENDYRRIESDFVPGLLMLAKSFQRVGRDDLAKANFDRIKQLRPDLASLADYQANQNANVLLVVDFGYAPHKATDFDGAIVGFAPTPGELGPVPNPLIRVDGQVLPIDPLTRPPVDLLALAQDRKWQSIDTIRAVKSALGTGLIAGGAFEGIRGVNGSGSRQRTDLMVAAGLIGSGLLLKATSQADTRQWEMLPRTTFIIPLTVPPGTHDITVDFPRVGVTQTWRNLKIPEKSEATYYFRMQRWSQGPFTWPPPTLAGAVP